MKHFSIILNLLIIEKIVLLRQLNIHKRLRLDKEIGNKKSFLIALPTTVPCRHKKVVIQQVQLPRKLISFGNFYEAREAKLLKKGNSKEVSRHYFVNLLSRETHHFR